MNSMVNQLVGILFGLASAVVWGSGDFAGGYATRKHSQYAVLVVAALSGLVVLVLAAVVAREALPSLRSSLWALLGGLGGALGIAAFYRALSLGHSAVVAPVAGVIGAAVPVLASGLVVGWPAPNQLAGFALALLGIWLVSTTPQAQAGGSRLAFGLACLAGLGFGGFLVCLGLVEPGRVFTPLILARSMTVVVGLVLVIGLRIRLPSITSNRWALLAGLLDAGGNLFYILARQFTRLDVAAVLSSLYPAATVCLSSVVLKEKVSRSQWVGLGVCLAAIAFITV